MFDSKLQLRHRRRRASRRCTRRFLSAGGDADAGRRWMVRMSRSSMVSRVYVLLWAGQKERLDMQAASTPRLRPVSAPAPARAPAPVPVHSTCAGRELIENRAVWCLLCRTPGQFRRQLESEAPTALPTVWTLKRPSRNFLVASDGLIILVRCQVFLVMSCRGAPVLS